ncbi:MAG: penicillin-binding transpeptidase domain-containing protein [Gammaproteobacteria bacterium]
MNESRVAASFRNRTWLLVMIFITVTALLLWRAFYLQILNKDFLRNHGDARSLRTVTIPAHRGMITDRHNEPLAISTPVDSIWVTPREVLEEEEKLPQLAALLDMPAAELQQMLLDRTGREFLYLKRHISPELAVSVNDLAMRGVNLQREYKRYYPAGEVTAHLLGFTNVDDSGQEGIELAFDHWLRGTPGEKRVLQDRLGRVVQNVESIRPADPGRDLHLSIDRRVQYLAYRELKSAVQFYSARGGSLVMLDAGTGEVMAMAVQPAYNPNNRSGLKSENYRNRAVTDVFEPGSTVKPFTIAAALMSGMYSTESQIATGPGHVRVSDHTIRDIRNYGTLDPAGIIKKSSNVGASKIALSLGPKPLWNLYSDLGFGLPTGSGFPGESAGVLNSYHNWSEVELATIAFGYGISMSALHLAQAYAAIANDGVLQPISLQRQDEPAAGRRIMPAAVARSIRSMLEEVVSEGGTGRRAGVPGYLVAGKTGTVRKSTRGGYAEDRYLSLFAGMAPSSDPDLVMVVVIDEPQGEEYYGGQVAAPVFSKVMKGALRILNIPPDDLPSFNRNSLMAVKD